MAGKIAKIFVIIFFIVCIILLFLYINNPGEYSSFQEFLRTTIPFLN